jgi:beta-lactamase regulating signal transducer with metallopeptidase domain
MTDLAALQIATHLFLHGTLVLMATWLAVRHIPRLPAASQHAVWTTAFAALLLLPIGTWVVPGWGVDLTTVRSAPADRYARPVVLTADPEATPAGPTDADASPVAGSPSPYPTASPATDAAGRGAFFRRALRWVAPGFLLVWAGGALLLLGRLALGTRALLQWYRSAADIDCADVAASLARQLDVKRSFTVRRSAEVSAPIAWGAVSPVIILPADAQRWPSARLRAVLLHELAHVKRWDYLAHILSRVARALFWPNPLIWMATERSTAAQERACDDMVLRSGVAAWEYAEQLLAVAQGLRHQTSPVEAVALNAGLRFKSRMQALLQPMAPHRSTTRSELGLILIMGLTLWGVVSAFHLGPLASSSDRDARYWLEAERASLPAVFSLREDGQASQGTYVEVTDRAGDLDRPPHTEPAVYAFETSRAGRHVVWARVRIRSDDHDSIWLRMDSTRWIRWNGIEQSDRWHWVQVQDADQEGRPVAFDLSEGPHQLMLHHREDGIAIDRLLVTRDWNFQPRATGESMPEAGAPHQIWLEAEEGWLQTPLRVAHAPHASGWQHLEVRPGANSMAAPPSTGHASYPFEVAHGGAYRLWGRVIASSEGSDSFWVQMDDGPWIRWNGIQQGHQWHWDEVHDADRDNEPVRFDLSPGSHRLTIAHRESHAKLDRLLLVDRATYRPRGLGDRPANFTSFTKTLSLSEAALTPPMVLRVDSQATPLTPWIEVPDGPGNDRPEGGSGAATFTFSVPEAGRYVAWGQVQAKARNDNSFYVSVNGGEEMVWHTPAPNVTTEKWRWDPISSGEGDAFTDPFIFDLKAGIHRLRIRNREDGTRLRSLRITNMSSPVAP